MKKVDDTAGAECLEICKLGTVEGKTRKGLPIPAGAEIILTFMLMPTIVGYDL
ncbi:hypothetical protein [Chamaesiphon minutus]|uniref:hypothetical protein n=1 Tax=Chamaesiphon minutus TaxID=1173032 RepID=UPI0002DF010E|nr:hypothetical protein [Chamaesiphon minutus]